MQQFRAPGAAVVDSCTLFVNTRFVRWFMNKIAVVLSLCLVIALTLLAGCGGSSDPNATAASTPAPLSADNLNLIFVVSEDLAYHAPGDVNPGTANLTNRGLQRSLRMATFLRRHVLGRKNVTGIYVLEPMTHLQTTSNYPDMAAPETIQQFALLNQITLSSVYPPEYFPYTGNSYPLNASYASGSVPTRSCYAGSILPELPGSRFRRPGRRQRNPGKRYHHGRSPGLLCLLGAMGDHQRPDGKYQ